MHLMVHAFCFIVHLHCNYLATLPPCSCSEEYTSVGHVQENCSDQLPQEGCIELASLDRSACLHQAQESIVEKKQERERCVELVQETCDKQTYVRDMKHAAKERCIDTEERERKHRDMEHTEENSMEHTEENSMEHTGERVIEHNEESFSEQAQKTCIEQLPENSRKMRRYTFDKTTPQTERSLQRNLSIVCIEIDTLFPNVYLVAATM